MRFLLASLLCCVFIGVSVSQGQNVPVQRTYEEIKSFPEGLIGPWQVGNQTFIATDQTKFTLDHPALVGSLVEVTFIDNNGQLIAVEIEPQSTSTADLVDGPHALWRDDGSVDIIRFREGQLQKQRLPYKTAEDNTAAGNTASDMYLNSNAVSPPAATWDMPSRLLVISDIEGNYQALFTFLLGNGVINQDGDWTWGDGHLLFNGDIVDRGDKVTETLLLIRRLQREAAAAGGRVHYVLVNHEAMIMAGDLRYVHPKYHFLCGRYGLTYDQLYGPQSEMGRWLRSQNTVTRIGPLLFVHGGYSPALNDLTLTPDQINDLIRSQLGPPKWPDKTDLPTSLAWNMQGPMWYRGYFDKYATDFGPMPTDAQLQSILQRHNAKHIVVGHSVVDDVTWIDDNQRLIGVDVDWADPEEAEGLILENGTLSRIDSKGVRRPLSSLPNTAP